MLLGTYFLVSLFPLCTNTYILFPHSTRPSPTRAARLTIVYRMQMQQNKLLQIVLLHLRFDRPNLVLLTQRCSCVLLTTTDTFNEPISIRATTQEHHVYYVQVFMESKLCDVIRRTLFIYGLSIAEFISDYHALLTFTHSAPAFAYISIVCFCIQCMIYKKLKRIVHSHIRMLFTTTFASVSELYYRMVHRPTIAILISVVNEHKQAL
jgi:hypothetical protein